MPIAALVAIIPELFMQLFFPLITKEYSRKNLSLIKELSKQIGKWIFLFNIPFFILLFIFPGTAINLLFGSKYLAAENALRILSIGALLSSMFLISSNLLSTVGRSKTILIDIVLAAGLNLVLNSIFIPMSSILFIENPSGLEGAAIATLISTAFLNLLFLFQAWKSTAVIPLRRKMLRILVCALVATLIILMIKPYVVINLFSVIMLAVFFFLIYTVLIFTTKSLDSNDMFIIKNIINKARDLYGFIKFSHLSSSYTG